jgi:hypothetical protein
MQVMIDAATSPVVAVGRPQPGNRNDCTAYTDSRINRVTGGTTVVPTVATKAPTSSSRTAAASAPASNTPSPP